MTTNNNGSNAFYNNLTIENNTLIMLNDFTQISSRYYTDISTYKFVLSSDPKFNEHQQFQLTEINNNNNVYIYQFNTIEDVHFVIPFAINTNIINIYIQFAANDYFELLKQFNISNDSNTNLKHKINYLLSVLEIYPYTITDCNAFFNKININIENKDISILQNHNKLCNFSPMWRKQDQNNVSNKLIINRLIEDLCVTQLSQYNEMLSSKYILLPFDENEYEYKLTLGYIKDMQKLISLTIPDSLSRIIYSYFQYYIIKGNDLAIINPKQKIFTSAGVPYNGHHTYAILSKPLSSGIYKFKIHCIVSADPALSIGFVTNPNADVPTHKYLFDDIECGKSYQMYLARRTSAIYHYEHGVELYKQKLNKSDCLRSGEIIEVEIDFYKYKITFFINSKQCNEPIEIKKNTTYYAAFAFVCYNTFFYKEGPGIFKYSFSVSG
eukprot:381118_1